MKQFTFFFSFLIIFTAVVLERGGMAWRVERPVVQWLIKKTDRSLPEVTAVILPKAGNFLVPQDVALTTRAMLSFHPRLILVSAPLGDLTNGPLSLIREAQAEGRVQETSFVFGSLPKEHAHDVYQRADILFFLSQPMLTSVTGKVEPSGSFGFILPHEEKENLSMPLFGKNQDGTLVGSLWWRGLHDTEKKENFALTFLLGGRMLLFPNNNVIWLGANACLIQKKLPPANVVFLDDFLLRREEMERGEIRPDLDLLFRNKTVIIGSVEAAQEAAILQDAQQQLAVRHLNMAFYGALLFLLAFGIRMIIRFSGIDFLLLLFFSTCFYAGGLFLLFHFFGILLPSLLPCSIVLIAFLMRSNKSSP